MSERFTLIFFWGSCESKVFILVRALHSAYAFTSRIRRKRPSLRIIVSSATLDATTYLNYFTSGASKEDVTIVSLEGRMYPVETAYLDRPTPDYVREAVKAVMAIHAQVKSHICVLVALAICIYASL